MNHGSLFSGIGGFDLASEWMGWKNVFHCELNEFGQKILKYYWPKAKSYDDITKSTFIEFRGEIDILTGGFPCQPFSNAGKRQGTDDDRYLWPEMLRVIREIEPRWIVGENVRGLVNWNEGMVFDTVCSDLESQGYEIVPLLLPAASVNAPHKRDRIWFVAYSKNNRCGGWKSEQYTIQGRQLFQAKQKWDKMGSKIEGCSRKQSITNTNSQMLEHGHRERKTGESTNQKKRIESFNGPRKWESFPIVSPICHGDDGLSSKLDGITFSKWRKESIKGGGNAIVPQVALQIFKVIEQIESNQ
ncbi:MAG: (cytosine-5-)-methyltransferase [Cyanobacteriota bacterium]|jgi:DNA (cytosine-5)-methyltransferase 1